MTEERAQIQVFLQTKSIVTLAQCSEPQAQVTKAGIVPFMQQASWRRYMVMKPVTKRPDLGEPEFQLCKGTRMFCKDGQWHDIRRQDVQTSTIETLSETALREGIEEIGLVLQNIITLYDCGLFRFTSASSGRAKESWMFAAQMHNDTDFLSPEALTDTTQAREWVTLREFKALGRPDHVHMLSLLDDMLEKRP